MPKINNLIDIISLFININLSTRQEQEVNDWILWSTLPKTKVIYFMYIKRRIYNSIEN
jgi:hypothetical protein